MPNMGEFKTASELGFKGNPYRKFIWSACADCGEQRWVALIHGSPRNSRCHSCANKILTGGYFGGNNPNWKGGEYKDDGYVFVFRPEHPKAYGNGYIKRARLVLEGKLGRPILLNMDSHHINGIKDDDRPENLMEIAKSEHGRISKHNIRPEGGE